MKKILAFFTIVLFLIVYQTLPTKNPSDTDPSTDQSSNSRGLERFKSGTRKLALVIGNNRYQYRQLDNPVNDATEIARMLKKMGFEVLLETNVNQIAMLNAIHNFSTNLSARPGVGLFYFAGHGVQVDGQNYLLPIDNNKILDKHSLQSYAVDAESILARMNSAKNSLNIIILDACRDNPFRGSTRSLGRGLARLESSSGSIIAFATSPGKIAEDSSIGDKNGLFTKHLLDGLKLAHQNHQRIDDMFMQVRNAVLQESNGGQEPWYSASLNKAFCFGGCQTTPQTVQTKKPRQKQRKLSNTGVTLHDYEIIDEGSILLKKVLKTKSIQEIKQAAEGGDAEAQYLLAVAYNAGEGIVQDKVRSIKWYRRSALKGFSRAQAVFAGKLYHGEGVSRNRVEAIEWYRTATENGNATALVRLGDLYRDGEEVSKDMDQALLYYKRALKLGYTDALTQLGYFYLAKASAAKKRGKSGEYKRTSKQALGYLTQGAKQDLTRSQSALGDMYYSGNYVDKNLGTALIWYQKAAKGRNIFAIERVAKMLEKGEGVGAAAPKQAVAYWRQGAELGSDTSRIELANRIIKGSVSPRSPNEVVTLYEQAIANGSTRAAKELALVYHEGKGGVAKNSKRAEQYALKALEFFEKADNTSYNKYPMYAVDSAHLLLKIYKRGTVRPSSKKIVKELKKKFGPAQKSKAWHVQTNCDIQGQFTVYVWDWKRDEPPTDMQFDWLSKARGCDAPKVANSFRKLYKLARENNVSFKKMTVYAFEDSKKK